jgi:hypothetical protein
MAEFQRQTGLPSSAGPGERDQPYGVIREPLPKYFHVCFAADQDRHGTGKRDDGQLVDGRVRSRCPRAPDKRVTRCTGQFQSRRQRAYGLDMGPSPFAALQRAHGMN